MPSFIYPLLAVVQVLSALTVIVLVLLQQGKGADMGSSFGGGSAGSLFGATGAANFFSRATKWVSILFFACTLGLAFLGNTSNRNTSPATGGGVMQGYEAPAPASTESSPAPASDLPSAPASPSSSATPAAPAASDTPAAPAASSTPEAPAASDAPAAPAQSEPAPSAPAASDAAPAEKTTPAEPQGEQNTNTGFNQ